MHGFVSAAVRLLLGERYLTLATWGLVLATLLLVVDSWNKGREQRKRWDREDLLRKQDKDEERLRWKLEDDRADELRRPKYQFGLDLKKNEPKRYQLGEPIPSAPAILWVANFGLNGLYMERLYLKHREMDLAVQDVNKMVAAGEHLDFEIPQSFWEKMPGSRSGGDNYVYGDHEVWVRLADLNSSFESPSVLYSIVYMQRHFIELRRGSFEKRQPNCPKCGQMMNALLPPTGLLTEQDVQEKKWRHVVEDLAASCPDHKSSHLEWIETPDWVHQTFVYSQKEHPEPAEG